jgi:hypothetical protein
VFYYDEDGKRYVARNGGRNYRNNNPGNLVPGKISKRNGQIGVAGGFAVFPDFETGKRAMADSLKSTHGDRSLKEMIWKYAPPHENDTEKYFRHLLRRTGVKDENKIRDFSEAEFGKLVDAILAMEGRKKDLVLTAAASGKKEIVRIRKDKKGVITHYEVADLGWLRKAEAIGFARAGEIDAVIATSKSGRPFLRTRPDVTVVNNLENKN